MRNYGKHRKEIQIRILKIVTHYSTEISSKWNKKISQ